MRVDFHSHTAFSRDSGTALADVRAACLRAGIDCLCITDHNRLVAPRLWPATAPVRVIAGEEILTAAGEIIGLFLSEEIPPYLSPQETVRRIRAQGGIVCLPHPFDRLRRRSALTPAARTALLADIDIVEVFNSRVIFPGDNAKAWRLAESAGKLRAAGSDAHTAGEIGHAYVEMPAFTDQTDFLTCLAQGRVVGRLSSPLVHLDSAWQKLRKRI
jgi:predicted metal-dependent phosphoesterase TrpH